MKRRISHLWLPNFVLKFESRSFKIFHVIHAFLFKSQDIGLDFTFLKHRKFADESIINNGSLRNVYICSKKQNIRSKRSTTEAPYPGYYYKAANMLY